MSHPGSGLAQQRPVQLHLAGPEAADTCCTCAVLQKDTLQVERLLQKGEQRLKEMLHPDPVIGVPLALSTNHRHLPCLRHLHAQLALLLTHLSPAVPYYPGGSLFERNPPMPKVCMVLYSFV